MKTQQYQLNTALHGLPKGHVVTLDVDSDGVPKDRQWRRRVADAKLDGCLSVYKAPVKKAATQKDDA